MAKQAILSYNYKAIWLKFAAEDTDEEPGRQELNNRWFFPLLVSSGYISLLQAPENKLYTLLKYIA